MTVADSRGQVLALVFKDQSMKQNVNNLAGRQAFEARITDLRIEQELSDRMDQKEAGVAEQLHEEIASQLAGINLLLGAAYRQADSPNSQTKTLVLRAQSLVRAAISQCRQLAQAQPMYLAQHHSLSSALHLYLEHLNHRAAPACRMDMTEVALPVVSADVVHKTLLVVDEAVTVARRRVHCRDILVTVSGDSAMLNIAVAADGRSDGSGTAFQDQRSFERIRFLVARIGAEISSGAGAGAGSSAGAADSTNARATVLNLIWPRRG